MFLYVFYELFCALTIMGKCTNCHLFSYGGMGFYQHHSDNRIGVNNRKKLPKRGYTSINFRQELTKEWEGGETVALSGKKKN